MPDITITAQDGGSFSAYLALPPRGTGPGIVLIQEIFGVNQVMRDLADGFAASGYVVLCPDLFWRQQPGIQITDKTEAEWQRAFQLYQGFDVDKGVQDLVSTLKHLRGRSECTGKVGTVGYCLGGKLAYLMATRSDADCNVSYYGVGIEGALPEAAQIRKPLILHVAGADKFVPPEAQAKIADALQGMALVEIHRYEGKDHAFARVGGQHYDEPAATLANKRTAALFAKHLQAKPVKRKPPSFPVTVHAVRALRAGGPEVLSWDEVTVAAPGAGQIYVRHTAVGLNYIDTYHRSGLYPINFPTVIGMEGAGVVEALGPDVKGFKVGDRIAYAQPMGSYAEARVMPADRALKIPAGIDDRTAAAMMLKGLTAQYLLRRTYKAQKGDTILVHAAAGGVGLILCQWGAHLGCTVIGTVGSDEKAELARRHGAHHVIVVPRENFVSRVKEITGGKGVSVVYDGVGKDTFAGSLDCLRPLGMMVTFGNASGPVDPMQPAVLGAKGSLFLTRPSLMAYVATRPDLEKSARDLFAVVKSGAVKIEINQTYPLSETAQAHRDLEGRKTTGSTVLLP